jgi:hypothetical protein
MSRDVILGTTLSAMGVGMYGLYYAWKMDRMRHFLEAETEIKLSEDERMCISIMLSPTFARDLIDGLDRMMRDEFGYDLQLNNVEGETIRSLFKGFDPLFRYFTQIQRVDDFHRKYNRPILAKEEIQELIGSWLKLFPWKPRTNQEAVQEDITKETDKILTLLLTMARETLKRMIEAFLTNAESDIRRAWMEKTQQYILFLKEKKCINISRLSEANFTKTLWVRLLSQQS